MYSARGEVTKEVRAYPGAQQITALAEKEEACQKKRWKEGEEREWERGWEGGHTFANNTEYEFLELELLEQRRPTFNFSTDVA